MEHRNIDGQPAILVVGDMALRHGGRTSRRTSDGDGCWQADGLQGERERGREPSDMVDGRSFNKSQSATEKDKKSDEGNL